MYKNANDRSNKLWKKIESESHVTCSANTRPTMQTMTYVFPVSHDTMDFAQPWGRIKVVNKIQA